MPALRNPRRERFCHLFVKCGVATTAYARAGYTIGPYHSVATNGSRLLKNADVKARIEELRRHMTARTAVTVQSLAEELDEARALALRTEQPSAAVQASTVKAKLFGHLVDRKEVGKPGDFTSAESAADVLEIVRKELGDDAARVIEQAVGHDVAEPPAPMVEDAKSLAPTHDGSGAVN